jgi:hypothetical protein
VGANITERHGSAHMAGSHLEQQGERRRRAVMSWRGAAAGAIRAGGRAEAAHQDIMERCSIMHMEGGGSEQQGGQRRWGPMLQQGVAVCTWQGKAGEDIGEAQG